MWSSTKKFNLKNKKPFLNKNKSIKYTDYSTLFPYTADLTIFSCQAQYSKRLRKYFLQFRYTENVIRVRVIPRIYTV